VPNNAENLVPFISEIYTTVGTMQPVGMQVLFEPRHAGRIIEQIGDREIDHRFLLPCN
jgi:hypothetical protein